MNEYAYLNTGKVVMLSTLIRSKDITKQTIIKIYDKKGEFITKGKWMQDNVLDWVTSFGIATKVGTGLSISFHLT